MIKKSVKKETRTSIGNRRTEPASTIVKPMRRVAALLGFLAKAEVHAIFKQLPFHPADASADPLDLWRESAKRLSELGALTAAEPDVLPDEAAPIVEAIKRRPMFRRGYDNIGDYHFGTVPAAALIAPQWYVDTDYIEELEGGLGRHMGVEELLRFTMPEGSITEPIVRNNQVLFTSSRLDLNALPVPEVREVGDGELEIVVRASSRPNYVQVAILNGKLLLTNGVHRVLALYRQGYHEVACVWRRIQSFAEAGISAETSLFGDQTFTGRRAAVLDFLNDSVAVPLQMRSMHQVMRLTIGVEQFQVPAIQTIR